MADTTIPSNPKEDEESKANTLDKSDSETLKNNTDALDNIIKQNVNYMVLGNTNIIKDYKWTVLDDANVEKYLKRVPKIILTEYQPTGNQFIDSYISTIQNAIGAFGKGVNAFFNDNTLARNKYTEYLETRKDKKFTNLNSEYQNLYNGTFTENVYVFPFISTYHADIINEWGGSESVSSADKFSEVLASVGSITGGLNAPMFGSGVGAVDRMKVWSPNSPATYSFTFDLHNTMVDGVDQYSNFLRNYNLVRTLKYNNLPERLTSNVLLQPAFYKVDIPGVHYSPASAISNLTIESVGQKDMITLPIHMYRDSDGKLQQTPLATGASNIQVEIPDAYRINITMTDMYVESKNLYESSFTNTGNKIHVVTEDPSSSKGTSIKGL